MSGCWVFVCGPSGAGKDSVIGAARALLAGEPRVIVAPRWVTRAAGPGSSDEEVGRTALAALRAQGGLAWHWEAHGIAYGIPGGLQAAVDAGAVVVVNGSRAHVAGLGARADVRRVEVTAPEALLRARLAARGREAAEQVAQRLARNDALPAFAADLRLVNDGTLDAVATRLAAWLRALVRP